MFTKSKQKPEINQFDQKDPSQEDQETQRAIDIFKIRQKMAQNALRGAFGRTIFNWPNEER